jgi:hypothetical protein
MPALSIKTVDFCFSGAEQLQFHFLCDRERSAVDRVASFLQEANAVIIDLENFSDEDIETLRATMRFDGRALVATPSSCANEDCVRKDLCGRFANDFLQI